MSSGSASTDSATPAEGVVEFRDAVPGSGAGLKLGYISLGESVPFIATVTKSLQAEAAAAGAELIVCDSALDGQKAVDCAKSFATQGVQGYLNFQVDQELASAVCGAGPQVPVIAIDIVQQPCQTAFMGAANTYAGELAGKAVGEFAKKEWNCEYDAYVSLESTASVDANTTRMGGYRTGFESVCPAPLTNEIILDADRTDTAQTKFADVLTTLPGKSRIIVVGLNDDGLVGALAAARAAGREKDIWMSGQGADQSAWCEIATNPNWIGDTGYFPEKYGKIGIPYLIDLVNGKDVPKDLLVPHQVITSANIAEFYDVSSC